MDISLAKKRGVRFLNLIIIVCVLLVSFGIEAIVRSHLQKSGFDDYLSYFIAFCFGVWIYMFLSDSVFETFYRSKERIDKAITNSLHELNTPVATIAINLAMLNKRVSDERSLQLLKRIKEASDSLKALYQNLEYRLKKEIERVDKEKFLLKEAVDESIARFEDVKGNISLFSLVNENVYLYCSKDGFQEVLDNLISNAIKYNKQNGSVNVEYKDGDLCIKDSGKGIDTKNLFTIFERYYQDDSKSAGLGIGLSIVKEFCDENSIQIAIDSKLDIGTTFCLDIRSIQVKAS